MKNRLNFSHNEIEISNYLSGRGKIITKYTFCQFGNCEIFFMQIYNNKEQNLHLVNHF